jgi:serine/threonine protein kinase
VFRTRPDCEEILNERKIWALDGKELVFENKLKECIRSNYENSYLYSILKSKLKGFEENKIKPTLFRCDYYNKEYKEINTLGIGSYSRVHEVIDENEKKIAIKIIPLNENEREFMKAYFEYFSVYSLEGLNLVKYFDSWLEKNKIDSHEELSLYIKMEFCNMNLKDFLSNINENFNRERMLSHVQHFILSELFVETLTGINFLHQNGIIHRNLHLKNILLKYLDDGQISIKISDFGFYFIQNFSEKFDCNNKENNKYLAPEVVNNEHFDKKADIYSLGIIGLDFFSDGFQRYS